MGGFNPLANMSQASANSGSQGGFNASDFFSDPTIGIIAGLLEQASPGQAPRSVAGGLSRGFGLASEMARAKEEANRKREEGEQLKQLREAQAQKFRQDADRYKAAQDYLSGEDQDRAQPSGSSSVPEGFKKDLALHTLYGVPFGYQSPEEKQKADIQTFEKKQAIKQSQPTEKTKSQQQTLTQVAIPLYEGVEDLIKTNRWTPGYSKKVQALAERLARAEVFPSAEASQERAESILTPGTFEKAPAYGERIKNELKAAAPAIAEAYKSQGKKVPDAIKKYLPNKGLTINDKDVLFTAEKYGITPEEVLQKLGAQ